MNEPNLPTPTPSSEPPSDFHARGEAAWQQYQRDHLARPVDQVFDRIDAMVEVRRRELQQRD